ncbi:hypothetical protein [Mesoterricola sediminis]|uniref:Uncharacterized protein n=1 Tax=Mesoterricola sediminis TaxID=2927980 RepID=A0AA48GZU6_9BACT|nr:hypothetical protein [Mesoterricola sediminis]BDU77430.1 hypothetical protein METESE_23880 [Mesoterricola sediminis]
MNDLVITRRTLALAALWTVAAIHAWILLVQAALIIFAPQGAWHWPDVYQVEVVEVDKDSNDAFQREVSVLIGGEAETISLPRREALELHRHDTFWVLDNFYATGIRPAQFRLTPGRLLAEYPEVLLLLALALILRIRRSRWGLPPEPAAVPEGERKVYRDTFHTRAQRHAAPEKDPSTSGTDKV